MLKKIICFTFLLFTHNIFAQSFPIDSTKIRTLRIDPLTAKGASVSQVFDEVNFIPLETTKESTFGNISQLRVLGNSFIIYDNDTKSVLFFRNSGKYINKINGNKIERTENDPSEFFGFNVVEENDSTYIVINSNKQYFYYNLSGIFLKKINQEEYNRKLLLYKKTSRSDFQRNFIEADTIKYDFVFFKDGKIIAKYFPISIKAFMSDLGPSVIGVNQEDISKNYLFVRNYEYNIYKLNSPKITLLFKLIFPAVYSLPNDFITNSQYIGTMNRRKFFDLNKEVISGLGNVHLFGDNLLFKIGTRTGDVGKKNMLFFNLKRDDLISINHLEPDSKSFYLPVTDAGKGNEFSRYGFLAADDHYLYTSYSSLLLHNAKAESANKNVRYNEQLNQYFNTQNKKSNPIIIQLKPKRD